MTTEEKAKAYDEAKAKISKAYNDNRCTIGFMNEIFPELKENKDEKISIAIIKHFKRYKEKNSIVRYYGVDYDTIIAWLEKQGKQKPAAWSEEDEHWRQKAINLMKHPDLIKFTPTLTKDTIDWLKSLCPLKQWEPSDEQIGMLIRISNNLHLQASKDAFALDKFIDEIRNNRKKK